MDDEVTRRFLDVRDELLRYMTRRAGAVVAEDIVQEVWLRLRERSDPAFWREPRAVIYSTAVNLSVDLHRRKVVADKAIRHYEPVSLDPDLGAQVDAERRVQRLLAALEQLPAQCREAFLLNRLENLTHDEIARRFGVSTKTIQRHIKRALRACVQVVE
jgi:RNA polymerase sigma factor (sigma-70 family)